MDMHEARQHSAMTEARSKIAWGEPPLEAVKALMNHGYTYEQAAPIVAELVKERHGALRQRAIWKLLGGGVLVAIPVIMYVALIQGEGRVPGRGFMVMCVGGCYGFWLLINGLLTLLNPKSDHGDMADG
jgi:hypothetical protein